MWYWVNASSTGASLKEEVISLSTRSYALATLFEVRIAEDNGTIEAEDLDFEM